MSTEPSSYEPHLKLSIALASLDAVLARLEAVRVLLAEVARPATPGVVSELEGAACGAMQDVAEIERVAKRGVEGIRSELRRVTVERREEPKPRPKRRLQVIDGGESTSEVPLLTARFPFGGGR